MKRTSLILLIPLAWVLFCSLTQNDSAFYKPNDTIEFDTIPYMVEDSYFVETYDEIVCMLEGKDSLSFKMEEEIGKQKSIL